MFTFFAHLRVGIQLNLGDDGNLLIPHTYIVGYPRDRDSTIPVCTGDPQHPKECYPTGGRDYKQKEIIDFSWRSLGPVSGVLIYAIDPSG